MGNLVLMLDEDEYFSMQANVLSPGYQSVVLRGYLVKKEGGETYIAPLLPQLFYGSNGTQLSTWRQYISGTGEQTILSRSGGLPTIPDEELYWRKVSTPKSEEEVITAPKTGLNSLPIVLTLLIGAGLILLAGRK